MVLFFLFLVSSISPYLGESNQSMQTEPFLVHEDVHLLRDMPKAVVSKVSHASIPTPP